jgi:hypothetical protein
MEFRKKIHLTHNNFVTIPWKKKIFWNIERVVRQKIENKKSSERNEKWCDAIQTFLK